MERLEIEYIPISEIQPYKNNPRKNDRAVDIVAKSIKEFGFRNPIILDKKNEIIAGHTRLKAAIKLGMNDVPVIWADDLTEEQVKAFRIMDNKSIEYAQWDWELLKGEFECISNLSLTGFSEAEIEKVMNPGEKFSFGDKEPKYQIQLGDIYQLGEHKLICGDSTIEETYIKLVGSYKAKMVFTDPPYGVSYSGINNPNGRDWKVIKGDDLRGDELYKLINSTFKALKDHLASKGAIYMFHASANQIIFETAINDAGFEVKQQLIWHKHHILGHSHYHWCHEPIFYACEKGMTPEFYGTRCDKTVLNKIIPEEMSREDLIKFVERIKEESTVWECRKDNTKDYIHPTQKPVKLAEKAIINSSRIGDIILEPFAGSGSTLMACENKNRKCYAIELDPVFCSHIIERWENQTNKKAVKL